MEAFGKEFVVDVHQNKLLSSPYFTLRYFKEYGELVQRQEAPSGCQYQGHVRGQEESTVILDTCHGLSGLIEDDEGRLYIEPYQSQGNGAHRIYKVKDKDWTHISCGTSAALNVTDSENRTKRPKSRSKRRVEEYYKNYLKHLKPKKTRYTELMLIVDNVVYRKYKQDIADVKRRVFDLVNAVDTIYRKINIRVSLSALEVWTDRDHIPYVKAGEDLKNLENHHLSKLAGVKHDCIHLLRGTMYDDFGGMAYRGEMCTRRSLGVNAWNYWGSLGPWLALSHEMGHNFNFDHDNLWPCKCLSPRGCVMGDFKTRVPGFSDCNLHNISSIDDSCLYNVPKKVLNPQCGNGKLEPGEECDCGAPEDCKDKDPCCKPNDCRLKKSSQCSAAVHKCCRNCQFSPLGTPCRKSTGQCDVLEVCTGKSGQCPPNDFIRDGKPCIGEEELLAGTYVENLKLTVLPKPITARHVKINPQYWERGLCMKFDLLGCSADSPAYASDPTSITSFNNFCVMPRWQSACSSDDGMEFVYKAKRECSAASSQFTLSSDGILKQHCSKKKICPSGGKADYGVALVISGTCDDEQSTFERTSEVPPSRGKWLVCSPRRRCG